MRLRSALTAISPYTPGVLKAGAVKLASNENPLGPSPLAVERIRTAAGRVNLYPDASCAMLREALGRRFGLSAEHFIIGNGSDEILVLIAGAYIEAGTAAVTSASTFSEYTFATVLFGGTMKYAPLREGRFDLKAIAALVDRETRIVFVCNPNNPTGTCVARDAFEAFLKNLPSDVLVVCDEAYFEYVGAPDYPDCPALLETYPNLVILRTFSKIYGLAGLRIGYGIARPERIRELLLAKEPFNVNLLAQEAALAALDDEEFLRRSVRINAAGKDFLYSEFGKLGLPYHHSEANFVCVNTGRDSAEVFKRVMELGVTIRPLKSFGLDEWIRVTVGTAEQNRLFVDCLAKALVD